MSAITTTNLTKRYGELIAKDRTTSFLLRLFTSPMRSVDFILGYTLPMVVFAGAQSVLTFFAAAFLGLPFTANTILAVVVIVPITVLFVGIGLLCGSLLNEKAVGGSCILPRSLDFALGWDSIAVIRGWQRLKYTFVL